MGRMAELGPKTVRDLEHAGLLVDAIKWEYLTKEGQGACIPIAYAVSRFLTLRGRPNRVAEAKLTINDPLNRMRAEVAPGEDGFLGHVVVVVTDQRLLLDGSLWTQHSKVLANVDVPRMLVTEWRRTMPSTARLHRLTLRYEPDLSAQSWRGRKWPWREIAETVEAIERKVR